MAIKIEDHGDHNHHYRTVNEEIMGLKIDDIDKAFISEAFGLHSDEYAALCNVMEKFFRLQHAAEDLEEDLPKGTMLSGLTDFLKSNSFKKLNYKLSTPNQYFMLGFAFEIVISKVDRQNNVGGLMGPLDLTELIENLKKRRK